MAAGLGFKTFTTGEVLTAADVNGYLMQGVLVFADAAARDAAITSPQEGQACYLKDTDAVLTYSGTAWVGFDDSNAIQNAIVDAKGDLISATAADTPARLAVGNNGETLVADDSTSTGLSYQANWAAGMNKIINGDFSVNQRAFTSVTADGTYGFDRFQLENNGGATFTAETFTLGAAPVAGYEAKNFLRCVTTGQSGAGVYTSFRQKIEDVRTLAGQTATVSFWAKAASGTPKISVEIRQVFGSGGSPSSTVNTDVGRVTLTTSWARYSLTVAVPSISGKTLGTDAGTSNLQLQFWLSAGTNFDARTGSLGIQSNTFDTWGVKLEAGSVATAFQTATGTLAGELAACQRYYFRTQTGTNAGYFGVTVAGSATTTYANVIMKQTMRTTPTSVDFSGLKWQAINASGNITAATISDATPENVLLNCTTTGATTGAMNYLAGQSNTAYVGYSAEL